MNILILSCGTRNKIVRYFRETLSNGGMVVCTDCNNIAPALYEADKFYIVPRITDPNYVNIILDICKKETINGVLSLIDPELSLLAKNADEFEKIGAKIIGSSFNLCELSLNKMGMYRWLIDHHYSAAKSYDTFETFYKDFTDGKISFPVFVKPINGSASISISKVCNMEMVKLLMKQNEGLMIQEFLNGQEIGADVYIDMLTGEVVSIFTKKKLVMRAGETDKSVSFKDPVLFELIEDFVTDAGFRGQIDIDLFEINGKYYISEVNPRFGGGYPHAYENGVNHMALILNNLKGIQNEKSIGNYKPGLYMMKYNDVFVKQIDMERG